MFPEYQATLHKWGEGQAVEGRTRYWLGQHCCTRRGPARAAKSNWSPGPAPLIENNDLQTMPVIPKRAYMCKWV